MTTVREDMVNEGRLKPQTFEVWFAELSRLAQADGQAVDPSDWRSYYDDAYSPPDAWAEDQMLDAAWQQPLPEPLPRARQIEPRRPPLALGTATCCGRIEAVMSLSGERYYACVRKGVVTLVPDFMVEPSE